MGGACLITAYGTRLTAGLQRLGHWGAASPKGPSALRVSLVPPPSRPRKATFRESGCEQREDLCIIPRVSHLRRGDISKPSCARTFPPTGSRERARLPRGQTKECRHSHPAPASVQVMLRVRPSPRGSSKTWTWLIHCVTLPVPRDNSPALPCPVCL